MRKCLTGVRGERAQARPAQQAELKLERQACRVYEAKVRWRSGAGGARACRRLRRARVRRCTALLTCLGRPCVLTLGLSQLDPIPPCLSDVSRVEHGGTESACVGVVVQPRCRYIRGWKTRTGRD